mmetsp:Transcript_4415/g.10609  ORF Transcript_4415/g.10609 Transcript_4415/m.10609 type:complete len:97 (+) Transcript_4415:894-1184(+)
MEKAKSRQNHPFPEQVGVLTNERLLDFGFDRSRPRRSKKLDGSSRVEVGGEVSDGRWCFPYFSPNRCPNAETAISQQQTGPNSSSSSLATTTMNHY